MAGSAAQAVKEAGTPEQSASRAARAAPAAAQVQAAPLGLVQVGAALRGMQVRAARVVSVVAVGLAPPDRMAARVRQVESGTTVGTVALVGQGAQRTAVLLVMAARAGMEESEEAVAQEARASTVLTAPMPAKRAVPTARAVLRVAMAV